MPDLIQASLAIGAAGGERTGGLGHAGGRRCHGDNFASAKSAGYWSVTSLIHCAQLIRAVTNEDTHFMRIWCTRRLAPGLYYFFLHLLNFVYLGLLN